MQNIVFLDYDGVINTLIISRKPFGFKDRTDINRDGFYYDIASPSEKRVSNLQAVCWLEKICRDNNANIVISSVWRRGHYEEAIEALYNAGLSKDIKVVGRTPTTPSNHRGTEIKMYLDTHPEIDNFIILDDDADMEPFMDRLVKTGVYEGITCSTYQQANDKFREKIIKNT